MDYARLITGCTPTSALTSFRERNSHGLLVGLPLPGLFLRTGVGIAAMQLGNVLGYGLL